VQRPYFPLFQFSHQNTHTFFVCGLKTLKLESLSSSDSFQSPFSENSFGTMSSGQRVILGDATGITNVRASSSRARRKSFCVSERSSVQAETPSTTDRRALLAEWRKQTRGTSSASSENTAGPPPPPSSAEHYNKKRVRSHDAPPLPPSGYSSASSSAFVAADGISARERLQLRKQQKRIHNTGDSPNEAVPVVTMKSTIEYYDDEKESVGNHRLTGRSPLLRQSLGGARRRSFSTTPRRGRASPMENQQTAKCE
jgi:hypothetical protein